MRSPRTRTFLTIIAANVHALRTRAGLTQPQLAEGAGIELTLLQRVECGEVADLNVDDLVAIASALEVSPNRLLEKAQLQ